MTIHQETKEYICAVEKFVHRKFQFKSEIEALIELDRVGAMRQVLEDVLFYAKFLSNAQAILNRTGANDDNIKKLKAEFEKKLEEISELLRRLLNGSPEDFKGKFDSRFFPLTPDCMNNLLSLLYELSWIKNYQLDNENAE